MVQVKDSSLPPLTFLQADDQDRRPSLAELQSEDGDRRPSITMYQVHQYTDSTLLLISFGQKDRIFIFKFCFAML